MEINPNEPMKNVFALVVIAGTAFSTFSQPFEFRVTLDEAPLPDSTSSALGYELNRFFANEGFPPITLDTTADTLRLPIGWGSENQGSDLLSNYEESWLYRVVNSTPETLYRLDNFGGPVVDQTGDNSARDGSFDKTLTLTDLGGYTVSQQEQDIQNGLWFMRIDSVGLPNGEIAGPLSAIPEPEHYAVIAGLALLGFGVCRARKKVAAPLP